LSETARTTEYRTGTPGYRAPELLASYAQVTNKVDIFAMGCILYELVTSGMKAFTDDYNILAYSHSKSAFEMPALDVDERFQGQVSEFVHAMLDRDFAMRPPARELQSRFSHTRAVSIFTICADRCDHKKAIQIYNFALKEGTTDSSVLKALGDCYKAVGRYSPAVEAYNFAIAMEFTDPSIQSGIKACAAANASSAASQKASPSKDRQRFRLTRAHYTIGSVVTGLIILLGLYLSRAPIQRSREIQSLQSLDQAPLTYSKSIAVPASSDGDEANPNIFEFSTASTSSSPCSERKLTLAFNITKAQKNPSYFRWLLYVLSIVGKSVRATMLVFATVWNLATTAAQFIIWEIVVSGVAYMLFIGAFTVAGLFCLGGLQVIYFFSGMTPFLREIASAGMVFLFASGTIAQVYGDEFEGLLEGLCTTSTAVLVYASQDNERLQGLQFSAWILCSVTLYIIYSEWRGRGEADIALAT
jgi:tetratricopeptide (TPR) repeat protein